MPTHPAISGKVLLLGGPAARRRLAPLLATQGWNCTTVETPAALLRRLRDDPTADLVVLAPEAALDEHLELCRAIKFDARLSFVSTLCLLPEAASPRTVDVFDAGADDCVTATASDREVVLRLQKAIRFKQATDSLEDAATVITALAQAVEGKDHYTCGHVERVGSYSVAMGRRLGIGPDDLTALRTGGVVHDIGKIGIPDQILNKPGKLTDEELAVMQRHPVIGHDILQPLRTFRQVLPIVRWHHERPNGTGYPDRLSGAALPLLPRIAAVADVFDALSTDRPYRPALAMPKCGEILQQGAQRGELDASLVAVFPELLDHGTLGTTAAAA